MERNLHPYTVPLVCSTCWALHQGPGLWSSWGLIFVASATGLHHSICPKVPHSCLLTRWKESMPMLILHPSSTEVPVWHQKINVLFKKYLDMRIPFFSSWYPTSLCFLWNNCLITKQELSDMQVWGSQSLYSVNVGRGLHLVSQICDVEGKKDIVSNRTWWPGFQLHSHVCCFCTEGWPLMDELCLELTLTWWHSVRLNSPSPGSLWLTS